MAKSLAMAGRAMATADAIIGVRNESMVVTSSAARCSDFSSISFLPMSDRSEWSGQF